VTARAVPALRRAGVLVLLVACLVIGSSLPSGATFADSATVSTTVATASVGPPTSLTASTRCRGNTATVTLRWNASTASRVSGYLIRVHLGAAYQDQQTVGPTATSWQGSTDTFYVDNYSMTFTVWTQTQYGWTAQSAHTPRILC